MGRNSRISSGIGQSGGMNMGGIAGSGIFGMFGTTIRCDSKDESMYCSLAKIINIIIMMFMLGFIFYIIYLFISAWSGRKSGSWFGKR